MVLQGYEFLLENSKRRQTSNRLLNGHARAIAESFAERLATVCPYVQSVALSGSVASGGYQSGDDIDFDLFVRAGTKYVCYLAANLIGLTYSWRFRKARSTTARLTFLLPKVICINVVWAEDESRPFVRQDAGMAFELLRCQPIVGAYTFGQVLARNRWLFEFFPQLLKRTWVDTVNRGSSRIGSLLSGAVLTETIFSWPGLGRYATAAAIALDFPAVLGVTLLAAIVYPVGNLLVDIAYFWLDPRTQHG